jgi:hypothetical protein
MVYRFLLLHPHFASFKDYEQLLKLECGLRLQNKETAFNKLQAVFDAVGSVKRELSIS